MDLLLGSLLLAVSIKLDGADLRSPFPALAVSLEFQTRLFLHVWRKIPFGGLACRCVYKRQHQYLWGGVFNGNNRIKHESVMNETRELCCGHILIRQKKERMR
jgi:hypothetical protein